MNWPKHPLIYEINTWVWLNELSRKYRKAITLASVPTSEWEALAKLGMDAVWLMGVWERSPAGRAVALKNESLLQDFRRALPDVRSEDVAGSPYCVRQYRVDQHLGGPDGLAAAREQLAKRKVQLILDLVPNHVAPDHPWASDHPEYFVRGDRNDLQRDPASFFETGGNIYARGRDPFFPAWPDVLQLNAFSDGLRRAAIETLTDIAKQCDGARCDMAMLFLNDVFEKTWGPRAGRRPEGDYWQTVIPAIKKKFPGFLFIAEAYWDLEWRLQQDGFDYCYDKRLYDRLEHENAESVRGHLLADLRYQNGLVRFIENHDEPRAASVFSPEKERAAAVTALTLPGARLIHEGQIEGYKTRLPVFLSRRPDEREDPALGEFYSSLLTALNRDALRNGDWRLCECSGWPDNPSFRNLAAWCWTRDREKYLIIVNLSDTESQALVKVPWEDLQNRTCELVDELSAASYERDGNEMRGPGLFVDLKPWAAHCFQVQLAAAPQSRRPSADRGDSTRKKRVEDYEHAHSGR